MTKKQERFVQEYLIDMNATQAAIRAGYSKQTAYSIGQNLLKKLEIKEGIENGLKSIKSEKIADATEVMEYLSSVMRGDMTEETLRMVGEGVQEITNVAVSAKDRLKAAEMLGKRYSMFTDKMNVDGMIPVIISGSGDLSD